MIRPTSASRPRSIARPVTRLQRGFTLIEAMIVVAIIGILAAVAIPAYSDYIRRGSLPEGFNQLSSYRMRLEQYYQDYRNYGSGTCGSSASIFAAQPSGAKYFGYACTLTDSGQGYKLTATGSSGTPANGHVYTVTHDNTKATTQFKGSAVSGKACWLVKGSEC